MSAAFQSGAFQSSGFQTSPEVAAAAFQSGAFQTTGFQTTGGVVAPAFQPGAFQFTGFQTSGIVPPQPVAEASGSWHERYSARRFYALRERIEQEREELRLAIAQIERKKRTITSADKAANAASRDAYKSNPPLGAGIDITALARDITQAAHAAARLRQMENELAIAAQMLEAELQDEDDLILVLAF